MHKNNRFRHSLVFGLFLVLLFLAGCGSKKGDIPKIEPEIRVVEGHVNETKVPLSSNPVDECALLDKGDGLKFCGFENEISGMKLFTCVQTFQQPSIPFSKVVITSMNYSHPAIQEADVPKMVDEKFEYDKKIMAGENFLEISNAFISHKNNQRQVEFFRGNFLIRVTEISANGCFNFDDLVSKVVERAEERVE